MRLIVVHTAPKCLEIKSLEVFSFLDQQMFLFSYSEFKTFFEVSLLLQVFLLEEKFCLKF